MDNGIMSCFTRIVEMILLCPKCSNKLIRIETDEDYCGCSMETVCESCGFREEFSETLKREGGEK